MQVIEMPVWNPYSWPEVTSSTAHTLIEGFRDRLRTQLDSTYWQVTDIPAWGGQSSSYRGLCFLVRALDGAGNLTGHEWLFGTTCRLNTNAVDEDIGHGWANDDQATLSSYWVNEVGSSVNNANHSLPLWHYAPNGYSGFKFDADGNLLGGDGGIVGDGGVPDPDTGNTPYGNIEFFLSSDDPYGLAMEEAKNSSNGPSYFTIAAQPDSPHLMTFMSKYRFISLNSLTVSGEIVVPYDSTDTNKHAFAFFSKHNGENHASSFNERTNRCYAIHPDTNSRVRVDIQSNGNFTAANSPRGDGKFAWEPISLTGEIHKGYFDPEVIREIGGKDINFFDIFKGSNHNFVKYHQHYAFSWPTGKMPWPIGYTSRK